MKSLNFVKTNFAMLVAVLIMWFIRRSETRELSFRPVRAFDGSLLCASGSSSDYMSLDDNPAFPANVPAAVRCGFYCTQLSSLSGCVGFNYAEPGPTGNTQCQFFNAMPVGCKYSTSCCYYQV